MVDSKTRGRLQLILIGLAFMGPLLVAYWLYFSGGWSPVSSTEHGEMFQPPISLPDVALAGPASGEGARLHGKWSLIVFNAGACDARCETALFETRQVRRRLGRDMDRVQRVLLTDGERPEPAFVTEQHPALVIVETRSASGDALAATAESRAPGDVYLTDPLGNLVMRFPAGTGMEGMHADLKKLLKISRIG